jgi:hypothetical protein
MKRKLILIPVVLILSGCYYSVDHVGIKKAIHFCGGYENIEKVRGSILPNTVLCVNGDYSAFRDIALPPQTKGE